MTRVEQCFRSKIPAYLTGVLCMAVSACSLAPELPSAERVGSGNDSTLEWPSLLPLGQLPQQSTTIGGELSEMSNETQALAARAEALRNRADAMKGDILTPADRRALSGKNASNR